MIRDFEVLMIDVKSLHGQLMQMGPVMRDNLGECNYPGVYLFTEKDFHLYVGRTRRLRARLLQHSRTSVKDAPFAFRLARQSTGRIKASYRAEGSRKALDIDSLSASTLPRQRCASAKWRSAMYGSRMTLLKRSWKFTPPPY